MNPNVKIYKYNGLCNEDEENKTFKECRDDIYKSYKKYIYERFI